MAEILTQPNTDPSVSPEQNGSTEGSLSYAARIRRGIGSMADGALSFADNLAAISLARDDLRLTRRSMDALDEPFDGLMSRQAQADAVSMGLEADIILDFRVNAQRAGHTDTDAMPDDMRFEAAQLAAQGHRDDLVAELTARHPDWTSDELQDAVDSRVSDISTLLSMSAERRDEYLAAQLQYQELQSAIPEIQAELSELRAERSGRLSKIGRAALQGVVSFGGRLRDLPAALSARAMVAGMSTSDSLRNSAPEKRRTIIGSAAGLAIAGIAAYIAYRAGHAPGANSANYTLANSSSPLVPTGVGSGSLPHGVGASHLPGGVGEFTIPTGVGVDSGNTLPTSVGTNVIPTGVGAETQLPTGVGSGIPKGVGAAEVNPSGVGANGQPLPTGVGSSSQPNIPSAVGGEPLPSSVGVDSDTMPNGVGVVGGENLSGVHSSSELFTGTGSVDAWPSKIRVSAWNSETLDGSLTGISRQMLVRSGISSPTADQVNALKDALMPQAQPNGWLLKGQELDLRPATKVLKGFLK
jgi:hypothetical protein